MVFTQQLIQFVIKHWLMVGAFVILLVILFIEEARSKGLGASISAQKAVGLMNHEQAAVVDIRDRNLFKEGHIVNAMNIPKADLEQNMNKLNGFKTRPIIVVDANGQHAMTLTQQLKKQGFENVHALSRGMQVWKNESMPTKKG